MEASSLVEDSLSPESTVTSLLSSSGHLRSSLRPPELGSTFRYRNQDYDSASAALDAYIADFERSCQSCRSLTGSLVLPRDPPSTPTKPRVGSLRNRDVLRERLTDGELDFLNLPVSSLHHRGNRDRLSMTTDELLSIPHDGSMPVTHTSAFIRGLLSGSGASQSLFSSTRPAHRTRTGFSSSQTVPLHLNQNPGPCSSRCRGKVATFNSADDSSSALRAADLHLPRWLTSNKSEVDCSEISSLPDLKYPAWIQRCDVSEPDPWDDCVRHGGGNIMSCFSARAEASDFRNWTWINPAGPPRTGAPSWVWDLEKDQDPEQTPAQEENRLALRDVRIQLAQQISLLAAGGQGSDGLSVLVRENRIESLIQKADQVLNSLSQTSDRTESPEGPVSPVNTEDLLLSSSLFSRDAAAAGSADAAATGSDAEGQRSGFHGNSAWKQPGPVEAVKQMLFRLQAVEAELERQQKEAEQKTLNDGGAEPKSATPSPSLQRALHHLKRLKLLVEEPRQKGSEEEEEEEEEEKEEDEGRYSSLSADGLISCEQEPS